MFNYTKSQIVAIPIMYLGTLIISIVLGYFLRNKKEIIRRIPIICVASILIILEIIKQIELIVSNAWDAWALPFHYCSSLMIWYALAAYVKNDKVRNIGNTCSFVGSLTLAALFLFDPTSIIGDACDHPFQSFSNFHRLIFHFIALGVWLLVICLDLYRPTIKDSLISLGAFIVFFVLATIMSYSTNTNFISVLRSSITFMENLRIKAGQGVYTLVMYLFGIGETSAVLALGFPMCMLRKYIKNKIYPKQENLENIDNTK